MGFPVSGLGASARTTTTVACISLHVLMTLERGYHFVRCDLIVCVHMEHVIRSGRNLTGWRQHVSPKSVEIVMNGVPMAPHGFIFGQNEARYLQEAF